jgi:outer membrane lipoprotein carrier protein
MRYQRSARARLARSLARMVVLASIAACALAAATVSAAAAATEDNGFLLLYRYLNGLTTLSTDFKQTVIDAHGIQAEAGTGSLQVQRPDHFRWDYRPSDQPDAAAAGAAGSAANAATGTTASAAAPGADDTGQLMVADGKNLWFYDRDLAQVTVKPVAAALSSTPITLLSSTPQQLRETFQITAGAPRDGLQWVDVKPHSSTADFSHAELGFNGDRLERMIVHDNLGQTVRIDFTDSKRNMALAPELFQFKPKEGIDVIGTAQ